MSSQSRVEADRCRFEAWARYGEESGDRPAIPAATVVVLRDGDAGLETLMLRKNSKIAFGGMWVFPGGRIDAADRVGRADLVDAARVAAVREAHEEVDLTIDPDNLVLFAHWIPPTIAPKRFATWFFAGRAEQGEVTIDDGEIVEMEWMTPADGLKRHHNGDIEIVPPTWVTLHTFSKFDTVDHALTAIRNRAPRHHATRTVKGENGPIVYWEGDIAFESGDTTAEGPRHRLEMLDSGYRYDDSGAL